MAGLATDKYGPKWVAVCGFALAAPAFLILLLARGTALSNEVALCVALTVVGLAVALITSPLAADLAIVVETHNRTDPATDLKGDNGFGQVFTIMLAGQNLGIILGPIWGNIAYKSVSWSFMSLSLTTLAVSALPICLLFTGGPLRRKQ